MRHCLWVWLLICGQIVLAEQKIGVLIYSGANNHNWKETTPQIERILKSRGVFEVETTEHPERITSEYLAKFEVIISNWNNFNKRDLLWSDAAHVTIHAGGSSFNDWQEYHQITAYWGQGTGHGLFHEITVKPTDAEHPITQGIEPFKTKDELWHNTHFPCESTVLTVLMTAFSSKDKGGSGKDEPVLTVNRFGMGRCVNLMLGHDAQSMKNPGFAALLSRSVEWAAGQMAFAWSGDGVAPAPVNAAFKYLKLGEVKPSGWIHEQMKRDLAEGFAGHLDELTSHASTDLFLNRTTRHDGKGWWDSETRGNWLDGYIRMAYLTENAEAIEKIKKYMDQILASQGKDGYIGIYQQVSRYSTVKGNGELWGQSRILLCLLSLYEFTGESRYLDAVEKAVKLTIKNYGEDRPYWSTANPSMLLNHGMLHGLMYVDVIEWLYRISGNKAYRDFGLWCYRDFCKVKYRFWCDDMQIRHLIDMKTPIYGHGPTVAEHMRVPLWAYYITGNSQLKIVSENAYTKIAGHITLSGALISDEKVGGRQPLPSIGCEYCTMYELLNSLTSAAQKTGNAGYADKVENLAFNAAQGARLANGKAVTYCTPENRFEARSQTLGDTKPRRRKLSPTHEDVAVCCNPNATKFMTYYVQRMWMRLGDNKGDGLVVLTYGPSSVTTQIAGATVSVHEVTDYPFSEKVVFNIQPERKVEFSLYLRNPEWSLHTAVQASGARVELKQGYYVINKQWEPGDQVVVSFKADIEAVLASNGEYAVKRGPLFYALPLPDKKTATKYYPLAGFNDYDVELKDPNDTGMSCQLNMNESDLGLTAVRSDTIDPLRPWDKAPIKLNGPSI
jgi:type 1 glutamine amidotransferase